MVDVNINATPIEEARNSLRFSLSTRKASLTNIEMAFLSALLCDNDGSTNSSSSSTQQNANASNDNSPRVDANNNNNNEKEEEYSDLEKIQRAKTVLDDDMLFCIPKDGIDSPQAAHYNANHLAKENHKIARNPAKLEDLYRAHEDGVQPWKLRRISTRLQLSHNSNDQLMMPALRDKGGKWQGGDNDSSSSSGSDSDCRSSSSSIHSDVEVRKNRDNGESIRSHSSWGEDDGGFEHYDAWEVLKDEYATDFGFDYGDKPVQGCSTTTDDYDECQNTIFRILGTSANDRTCMPHVLSPPLMESLLNFVPAGIESDNFWLKFSMVRDGASLQTLKKYVRGAENTIIAIETTTGQVFGSFTSCRWRNQYGFYGSGPAFLWRMRNNRRSKCFSLFHQAQMESEIDVYEFSGLNQLVQVCNDRRIAVGGGKLVLDKNDIATDQNVASDSFPDEQQNKKNDDFGFGIAINEDLVSGTSSPCGTFRNPCLCKHSSHGEAFKVANLEVWTFTPCMDVDSAEKLEMTKFFMASANSQDNSGREGYGNATIMNAQDLYQKDFYRRVGQQSDGTF